MRIAIIKDLRKSFGPARDQDPRPTCMAFAASDAHAGVRRCWDLLSTEWAYYHALKRDGGAPHQGATMASMLQGIQVDGQPREAAWPYIPELFTDMAAWKRPAAKQLFRCASRPQIPTVERIVQCLDDGDPVLFVISISKSFYLPDRDGVIMATEPLEPMRLHALIAVGYGHTAGETFILVRNSWGEVWGVSGYAWISRDYLALRLRHAATMERDD